jgi:rSAM/selenodomain-associated transferase 2
MISVVIPVLNEEQIIGSCLSSLKEQAGRHEVVVVDGGSRDGTMDVVSAFPGVKWVRASRGRSTQMNRGADAAVGDILLFLHADTHVPQGGLEKIELLLENKNIIAVSFSLSFDIPSPLLRLYSLFSRINHILFTYGDQGLFMSRHVYNAIGGFQEIPIMEDVEIQKRLRKMGRFVKMRCSVITSARRFLCHGILRQQALNVLLVTLYHLGVEPSRLKDFYGYPSQIG